MKKCIICLIAMVLLCFGNGCDRTQNKNSDNEDIISTDEENQDETNDENQSNSSDDVSGDRNPESSDDETGIEFYIETADVQFGAGFEKIGNIYKEVVRDFARMSLLGYGGKGCLTDIKEINDRIFAPDSVNREDYIARMNAFEEGKHEIYFHGRTYVTLIGQAEENENSFSVKVRFTHSLTCINAETHVAYKEISTAVIYKLNLIKVDGVVYIASCEPNEKNPFDGVEGNGIVEVARPVIDLSDKNITLTQDFEQLTEDERTLIRQFAKAVVYSYGGYEYLEEVKAIEEDAFWKDSQSKYDYELKMKQVENTGIVYIRGTTEVRLYELSGTEGERIVKISVYMSYTYGQMDGDQVKTVGSCGKGLIYTLTLKRMGKLYITECEAHEYNH